MKREIKRKILNDLNALSVKLSALANEKKLFIGNTDVNDTTPVKLTAEGQDVLDKIITLIKQHQNLSLSAGSFELAKMGNEVGISNSALLDIRRAIRSIKEALKKPSRKERKLRVQSGSIDPYSVDIRTGSIRDIFTKG